MKNNNAFIALLILASFSGMAGIAYEIVYIRTITSFIFGEVNYIVTAILIGVFSGLAVGAYFSERLFKFLWLIEISLGTFSLVIAFLIHSLGLELSHWVPSSYLGSILFVFSLCFLPFFLIGMGVPSFALLLEKCKNANKTFTTIYSIYNIFAACSILISEYLLIRLIGLTYSLILFGFINIFVGVILKIIIKNIYATTSHNTHNLQPCPLPNASVNPILFYTSAIILGVIGSMWQFLYLDFSLHLFGPFQETFSLVFFAALLGIGIGSAIARFINVSDGLLYLLLIFLLAFLAVTSEFIHAFAQNFGSPQDKDYIITIRQFAIVLFGLPLFCLTGIFVPLVVQKSNRQINYGTCLAIVSIGNVLGILIYCIVCRQFLSIPLTFLFILCLVATVLILPFAKNYFLTKQTAISAIAIGLGIILTQNFPTLLLSVGSNIFQYSGLYQSIQQKINSNDLRVYNFSRPDGKNYVLEDMSTKSKSLAHNGYRVFGFGDMEHLVNRETALAALAAMHLSNHQNAYLVGLGTGITAMGTKQFFDKLTVVDINPAMAQIAKEGFAEYNDNIVDAPDTTIIFQDAIVNLNQSEKKYDAVINTASSPLYFSTNKIYTADFYRVTEKKITPDGIYVGWLDSRIGYDGIMIARSTLLSVFTDCDFYALNAAYYIFACGKKETRLREIYDHKNKFTKQIFESIRIPDKLFKETQLINTLDRPLLSYARLIYENKKSINSLINDINFLLKKKGQKLQDCCSDSTKNNSCKSINLFSDYCNFQTDFVSHDDLHDQNSSHSHEDLSHEDLPDSSSKHISHDDLHDQNSPHSHDDLPDSSSKHISHDDLHDQNLPHYHDDLPSLSSEHSH